MMPSNDSNLDLELRTLLADGRKIEAVRRYREATGTDLAMAKAAVEALEPGRPPVVKSSLESEIVSLLQGGSKIEAIRLYRERMGVGLKESKDAVKVIAAERHIPLKAGCLGVILFMMAMIITAQLWAATEYFKKVRRRMHYSSVAVVRNPVIRLTKGDAGPAILSNVPTSPPWPVTRCKISA